MKKVSEAVVKRLPRYYRYIKQLKKNGVMRVSSGKLAELLGITASQVRQDFANFGGFGQQGYGYDVDKLLQEFANILGLNKTHNMIIIGAGNMGRALCGYPGFKKDGFIVKALFDIKNFGFVGDIPVLDIKNIEEFLQNNQIDIAIITTQANSAEKVAKQIIDLGITNIWNFAPIDIQAPNGVIIENMSMSESLYVLSYKSLNK